MDNLRYVFNIINQSNTGSITTQELLNFFINIDPNITITDMERLISIYDTNNNNTLEFDEFVNAIGTDISNQDLINAFNFISNADGNGINVENFTKYYNLLNIQSLYRHSDTEYINILIRMIGSNSQQFIEFWNFINNSTS